MHTKKHSANFVERSESSSEEEILTVSLEPAAKVNTVSDGNFKSKLLASMEVGGKLVSMQIDTGATCNVISEFDIPPGTQLSPTNVSLRLYSNLSCLP